MSPTNPVFGSPQYAMEPFLPDRGRVRFHFFDKFHFVFLHAIILQQHRQARNFASRRQFRKLPDHWRVKRSGGGKFRLRFGNVALVVGFVFVRFRRLRGGGIVGRNGEPRFVAADFGVQEHRKHTA
jgi:hypothetical protein